MSKNDMVVNIQAVVLVILEVFSTIDVDWQAPWFKERFGVLAPFVAQFSYTSSRDWFMVSVPLYSSLALVYVWHDDILDRLELAANQLKKLGAKSSLTHGSRIASSKVTVCLTYSWTSIALMGCTVCGRPSFALRDV
jgi:hypothetical protein